MQAAALEVGLYQMPTTSGEVPAIFLCDEVDDEVAEGDVLEPECNGQVHGLSQEDAIVLD